MIGTRHVRVALPLALFALASCASPPPPLDVPGDPFFSAAAPDSFDVTMETTKGDVVVRVKSDWAPRGAARFHALVRGGYYDGLAFFRVIRGFVAQFGLHGDTAVSAAWKENRMQDDSVRTENVRGTLTFARAGANTRTTQLFFNLGDNRRLDNANGFGFAPIGRVVEGLPVLDALNGEYAESVGQDSLGIRGDAYLVEKFPRLDRITRARVTKSWD